MSVSSGTNSMALIMETIWAVCNCCPKKDECDELCMECVAIIDDAIQIPETQE